MSIFFLVWNVNADNKVNAEVIRPLCIALSLSHLIFFFYEMAITCFLIFLILSVWCPWLFTIARQRLDDKGGTSFSTIFKCWSKHLCGKRFLVWSYFSLYEVAGIILRFMMKPGWTLGKRNGQFGSMIREEEGSGKEIEKVWEQELLLMRYAHLCIRRCSLRNICNDWYQWISFAHCRYFWLFQGVFNDLSTFHRMGQKIFFSSSEG